MRNRIYKEESLSCENDVNNKLANIKILILENLCLDY